MIGLFETNPQVHIVIVKATQANQLALSPDERCVKLTDE